MPTVTITLSDAGGTDVDVKFECEPGWPGPAAEDQTLSPAQQLGLEIMDKMKEITGGVVGGVGIEGESEGAPVGVHFFNEEDKTG